MTVTPAAMPGAKPPARPCTALEGLAEIGSPEHPWGAAAHAAAEVAAAILPAPERPTPSLMPPTSPRVGPLYGIQFLRKEAVRLAIDSYREADRPTDYELLATADLFAEFIRNGSLPAK